MDEERRGSGTSRAEKNRNEYWVVTQRGNPTAKTAMPTATVEILHWQRWSWGVRGNDGFDGGIDGASKGIHNLSLRDFASVKIIGNQEDNRERERERSKKRKAAADKARGFDKNNATFRWRLIRVVRAFLYVCYTITFIISPCGRFEDAFEDAFDAGW